MFKISNSLAYSNAMVHQKKSREVQWPASCWFHVPRCNPSDGNHWLPAEGQELRHLLQDLITTHKVPQNDIFLISPFRDVVKQLRIIRKEFGLNEKHVGTIHTTQGKEADVVILVLGGSNAGVRDWAASKPNLLNVAVSRAKVRFYVIGERNDWQNRPFFDVLSKFLPENPSPQKRSLGN
ncbi:MAG: hypothetical protein FPO08_07645 [Geobacter sp.]|nr:MAG: hypothetical protein FPO08_07645 [Geobacter sp.]